MSIFDDLEDFFGEISEYDIYGTLSNKKKEDDDECDCGAAKHVRSPSIYDHSFWCKYREKHESK